MYLVYIFAIAVFAAFSFVSKGYAFDHNTIKQIQYDLNLKSYGAGSVDGAIGKGTKRAIRAFQHDNGYPITGQLSNEQVNYLRYRASHLELDNRLRSLPAGLYATKSYKGAAKDLIPICRLSRKSGIAKVAKPHEECGYIDTSGNWVIKPIYDFAEPFGKRVARVVSPQEGQNNHVLDISGDITQAFDNVHVSESALSICVSERSCGLFSLKGANALTKDTYEEIYELNDPYFNLKKGQKHIVFDALKAKDQTVWDQPLPFALVRFNPEYSVFLAVTKNDVLLLNDRGREIERFSNSRLGGNCPDQFVTIDRSSPHKLHLRHFDGTTPTIFEQHEEYYSSRYTASCGDMIALVKKQGRQQLLKLKSGETTRDYRLIEGTSYTPGRYYTNSGRYDEVFVATDDNHWRGLADWQGHWIIPPRFHEILIMEEKVILREGKNSYSYGILQRDENDKLKFVKIAEGLFARTSKFVNGHPIFQYGDLFDFSSGEFSVTTDGEVIPKSAEVELGYFRAACDEALGKSNKEVKAITAGCLNYYTVLAAKNHPEALYSLGFAMLYSGEKKGVEKIIKSAEEGYVNAQAELGFSYFEGMPEVELYRDDGLGLYWSQRAAENGHTQAQFNVGVAYMNGRGTSKDLAKAYYWFKRAAAKGHEDAKYNVALFDRQHQRAAQHSRGLTLGDLFRDLSRHAPSQNELANQRAVNQCKSSIRKCVASCASIPPPSSIQFFGKTPREQCEASCRASSC